MTYLRCKKKIGLLEVSSARRQGMGEACRIAKKWVRNGNQRTSGKVNRKPEPKSGGTAGDRAEWFSSSRIFFDREPNSEIQVTDYGTSREGTVSEEPPHRTVWLLRTSS